MYALAQAYGLRRVKRRRLALWHLHRLAEKLGRRGLVKLALQPRFTNCLEQPHGPESAHLPRVLGNVEAHAHVALSAKVVDSVRLDHPENLVQRARIVQVAVDQPEPYAGLVWIPVQVIDTVGVEARRTPDEAINLVVLGE